jgi:tRNA dimethylallyltransferase
MNKVIAIVGPTASGKSALAVAVAQRFSGEVISADSRQIYRELSIGTAKITREEMHGVPHHLIDIRNLNEPYSAHSFLEDALSIVAAIHARQQLPIICGGTFFYVDTLLNESSLPEVPPNETLRTELEKKDAADLFAALEKLDPVRAATVDPDNKRRLIRALEIIAARGAVPVLETQKPRYPALQIGLRVEKGTLLVHYKERAASWLKAGLLDEVAEALKAGTTRERLKEIGFEYTLALALLEGEITEAEFGERFVEKNWQYAKRQYTWLKRNPEIVWFEPENQHEIFSTVEQFLAN